MTLIELLAGVAVLGILLAYGVPSFGALLSKSRAGAYANDVIAAAKHARGEALRRRGDVVVCGSSTLADCDDRGWTKGVLVFADSDGDAELGAGDAVLTKLGPYAPGDASSAAFAPLVYGPTGALRDPDTRRLSFCAGSASNRRSITVLFLVSGKTANLGENGGVPCS